MRRTALLLVAAVLVAGCSQTQDPARPPVLPPSQWPVLGASGPVIGVDLYALRNYPAAEVRVDGTRTLSYIKNVLKANAVGIVWNFFDSSDSSDTVQSTSATLSASNVAVLTRIAERDGMLVEYRPVIQVPSEPDNWSGLILPADQKLWFDSYYQAELPYLRTAESLGVREFVAATEMHYLNDSPLWSSLFTRIASVYHGVVSDATWDDDYFPPSTRLPTLKYLGMDMYWHMPNLPANATLPQVMNAWRILFNEIPTSVLQRTAIDETGIEARAGAYANPPVLGLAGKYDEQVQVNWFTAACKTVHLYHMRGVFFWKVDLTDNPAFPASSLSTFEGRQAAKAISECG